MTMWDFFNNHAILTTMAFVYAVTIVSLTIAGKKTSSKDTHNHYYIKDENGGM